MPCTQTPCTGPFADLANAGLGWGPLSGRTVTHPELSGLPRRVAALAAAPAKYGGHSTLRYDGDDAGRFRLLHRYPHLGLTGGQRLSGMIAVEAEPPQEGAFGQGAIASRQRLMQGISSAEAAPPGMERQSSAVRIYRGQVVRQ